MSLIEYENRNSANIIKDIREGNITFFYDQRSVDTAHVDNIIETQQEYFAEYKTYMFTNSFIFGELRGREYILDGQHRLECIRRMGIDQTLPCTVVKVKDNKEMRKFLLLINSNKPYVQVLSQDVKIVEEFLSTTYKKYVKISKNPNRPHFNMNTVVEKLNIYGPFNSTKFIRIFNDLNNKLRDTPSDSIEFATCSKNKCSKSRTVPFYLGITKSDEWICKIMTILNSNSLIVS